MPNSLIYLCTLFFPRIIKRVRRTSLIMARIETRAQNISTNSALCLHQLIAVLRIIITFLYRDPEVHMNYMSR